MTGMANPPPSTDTGNHALPVVRQWNRFLVDFGDMLQAEPPLAEQSEAPFPIDIERATAFFQEISEALDAYQKSGAGISFWEVASIDTDEVKVCGVLAWLLDCHGSHGQGSIFARALLDSLRASAVRHRFDSEHFPSEADLSADYEARRECSYEELISDSSVDCSATSIYSRVDIQLSGKGFLLFIEAKVYSGENGDQLRRYRNHLDLAANGRKRALVYLTRQGRLPDDATLHGAVLPLRWCDLADAIVACSERKMLPGSIGQILIKQFCKHISKF